MVVCVAMENRESVIVPTRAINYFEVREIIGSSDAFLIFFLLSGDLFCLYFGSLVIEKMLLNCAQFIRDSLGGRFFVDFRQFRARIGRFGVGNRQF